MHETNLVENILKYLENEEKVSSKRIKRIYVSVSLFAGMAGKHFLEHFYEKAKGTKWDSLEIEVKEAPYGSEIEITRIDYE